MRLDFEWSIKFVLCDRWMYSWPNIAQQKTTIPMCRECWRQNRNLVASVIHGPASKAFISLLMFLAQFFLNSTFTLIAWQLRTHIKMMIKMHKIFTVWFSIEDSVIFCTIFSERFTLATASTRVRHFRSNRSFCIKFTFHAHSRNQPTAVLRWTRGCSFCLSNSIEFY